MKFVTGDSISTDHDSLGKIEVAVEYPQIEGDGNAFYEEFVSFAGGNEVAEKMINKLIEDKSKGLGRVALRAIPENGNLADATPRIQGIVKGYTPQAADGREARAAKVKFADNVAALLQSDKEFTREQLLELLAQAK